MYRCVKWSVVLFLLLALSAQAAENAPNIKLELFLVSPGEGQTIRYGRKVADLARDTKDPDTVARELLTGVCDPAILHSTSWRWEKDGTLILTYLAYSEDAKCRVAEPSTLAWSEVLPPQVTDPKKPRPAEIRTQDVLAHGLRHITFLVRYSQDDRIRKALSPESLKFFRAMCGQLAGRFETAREFADCSDTRP